MKALAPVLALLVPLCSCQSIFPPGSFRFNFDLGAGLRDAVGIGLGIWLSALQMCDRTQDELLNSAGEAFCFDGQFPCSPAPSTAVFCVVGLGTRENEAQWVGGISAAEMLSGCADVKRMLPELSPSRSGNASFSVYLCRQEAPRASPLIRLDFHGAIQSPGNISITCESAELVGWDDVRFVEPGHSQPQSGNRS
jgi:hypothetical protein